MRIRLGRSRADTKYVALLEVVTPRTNTAAVTAAENLLAAVSLPEPFSLEMAATCDASWFLVRTGSPEMQGLLTRQIGACYPQAEIRQLDLGRWPGLDPAYPAPGEKAMACRLVLRRPPCLPLRTFGDMEIARDPSAQADPVLGVLATLANLPPGWRALSQLVLRPAPPNWCRGYEQLLVERPYTTTPVGSSGDGSTMGVAAFAGLLVLGACILQIYQWYQSAQWLNLALLGCGVGLVAPGLLWLGQRLGGHTVYDPRLVREKISRMAYLVELRLTVFAPQERPEVELEARVSRLAAAYHQYDLAAGNSLASRPLAVGGRDLRALTLLGPARQASILNMHELAGLWHLPLALADVPLLERTGPRLRLPQPFTLTRGCHIGVSTHQGREVPVCLPEDLLRRHLLLVAKTRRGKSSLLLRIVQHVMEGADIDLGRPALILIDPHRDLARAALGLVPPGRRENMVYLDVGNSERPFGLNLLDTGLGWARDKAVANTLLIFRREFDRFWGPRMEDAFRYALLTLYEANEAMCAADPEGRSRQHTVLEVPALLTDTGFRRRVVTLVRDPLVKAWWSGYYDTLDRRLQLEIINPVQTKVQRFAGSWAARAVVGQPKSTIEPSRWLSAGAIVLVNTAKGEVGEDTAALIGGTIVNLVGLLMGEQSSLPTEERRRATLVVDEFHTMPGADYETVLSELAKYGANLVLATQSLARLDALDRDGHRALRAAVFANLDGLFAFHTSAEDGTYLSRELGSEIDEGDLLELVQPQNRSSVRVDENEG
ncbi:MAG: DUF87 domain-containing protein, partial [Chloroflexi bacterium]|nr:DUF87 domain-containing protein [Chloroflexota bacterium]